MAGERPVRVGPENCHFAGPGGIPPPVFTAFLAILGNLQNLLDLPSQRFILVLEYFPHAKGPQLRMDEQA